MSDGGKFIEDLRRQIFAAENRRASLVRQKMAFVIVLMTLGSISIMSTTTNIRTWGLFYFVPFIALVFDFCILAESFVINRARLFIRKSPMTPEEEKLWETSVGKQDALLPTVGGIVVSMLVMAGALIALWKCDRVDLSYWVWTSGAAGVLAALGLYVSWNRRRLKEFEESVDLERVDRARGADLGEAGS